MGTSLTCPKWMVLGRHVFSHCKVINLNSAESVPSSKDQNHNDSLYREVLGNYLELLNSLLGNAEDSIIREKTRRTSVLIWLAWQTSFACDCVWSVLTVKCVQRMSGGYLQTFVFIGSAGAGARASADHWVPPLVLMLFFSPTACWPFTVAWFLAFDFTQGQFSYCS